MTILLNWPYLCLALLSVFIKKSSYSLPDIMIYSHGEKLNRKEEGISEIVSQSGEVREVVYNCQY